MFDACLQIISPALASTSELAQVLAQQGYEILPPLETWPAKLTQATDLLLVDASLIPDPGQLKALEWQWQCPILILLAEQPQAAADMPAGHLSWPGELPRLCVQIELARQAWEKQLRTEPAFRSLIQHVADILVILNADFSPRYLSPSLEQITGFKPEELMQKGPFEIMHPEDIPQVGAAIERCQADPSKPVRFEYRHIHSEQGYVVLESVAQNFLHHPEIQGFVVVSRDITERTRIQELLQISEQRYRIVAEQTGQVLYDWDVTSGQISWVGSIEAMTGFSYEAYQAVDIQRWESMIHPEDRTYAMEALQEAEASDGRYSIEYRLQRQDLSYFYVEDNGVFLKNQAGIAYRMLGTMKDVSERRQANARLHSALQEREILLQEIHHRVKNNFQIMSSLLNLQARKLSEPEAQKQLLEARDRIRSMALVHDRLYRLANMADIDMADYLSALVKELHRFSFASQVELRLALEPVRLDVEQAIPCGLLVNELLTNAFKYAFPSENNPLAAWIQVGLSQREHEICLMVHDSGIGLPESVDLEAHQTLGLQLIKSLAQQLQARFVLERSQGTRWEIVFEKRAPKTLKEAPITKTAGL